MGDLLVAGESGAPLIAKSPNPVADFPGIALTHLDVVKMTQLHALLTGRPYKELLREYDPIVTVAPEGPWIFRVPLELVSRLATLPGAERKAVAERWAGTDEFKRDRWTASQAAAAFETICSLAKKASEPNAALFLRMSL
jgi:hypothetical protein